jgi:8-amino-7-oxononanoate synthase
LLRGDRADLVAVERRFATFKKTEASLYFGSGYTANIGVLGTFIERHDVVLTDAHNHASIVDGIRLSRAKRQKFRHCDVDDVARKLRALPASGAVDTESQRFLITESLFSMDGDFAPLADYAQLCHDTGTVLIVDEAHAVGVYGETGSGWIEQTNCGSEVFLSVDTAGKAMGVSGAFVSGPLWAIDYLIQRARPFMFTTAPPPALAAALDASLDVIGTEPERRRRVQSLGESLRGMLAGKGLDIGSSVSHIIPVILGENERAKAVAAELQREGFDVRAIRPPAVPAGTARLRISVNALLDESLLQRFTATLEKLTSCSVASS